jgi:uncharacterized ferritin-like protein (DUF455 family)
MRRIEQHTIITLSDAARRVLNETAPLQKVARVGAMARDWQSGAIATIGIAGAPARPARPERPELRRPGDMPKRRASGSLPNRIALLHALAHIELNAIDLACDMLARFAGDDAERLPREFADDWLVVAAEEAKHFALLSTRLNRLGAAYGDLPAHDGLWEAAENTAHDLTARLAIVPLVLEARGLDVTPSMIANLDRAGDIESAAVLRTIYEDEIGHVAIGWRWFRHVATAHGFDPETAWPDLVREHFRGKLKPPFNEVARTAAGLQAPLYQGLV